MATPVALLRDYLQKCYTLAILSSRRIMGMSPGEPRRGSAVTRNGVCLVSFAVILISLMLVAATAAPQNQAVLQITEPSEGAIVNPGQTLNVRVTSPTPALFPEVFVGGDATPFAGTISPLPGELSVP